MPQHHARCRMCERTLPLDAAHFHMAPTTATGFATACVACRNREGRAYYARTAEKRRRQKRKRYLERKAALQANGTYPKRAA